MRFERYITYLEDKLKRNYDIFEGTTLAGETFELFGKYFLRTERYFASKKAVIYGMENNDYLFVKYLEEIDENTLGYYFNWVKTNLEEIVKPHDEHMSSTITLGLVVDGEISPELIKKVENIKLHKGFALGFKGWVDFRLVVYNLRDKSAISNKKGREVVVLFSQ